MRLIDLNKLKKALPLSPGIFRKDEYFNSAVIVPFINIKNEYHLIFEERAAGIRQGGELCFPGGEFDPDTDKNYKETAVRETVEEFGIDKNKIKVLGQLDTLFIPAGVIVNPFVAEIDIEALSELSIDKIEVEKVFTVPLNFFLETSPEIYHLRLEIHPHYTDKNGNKVELLPVKELQLPDRYLNPWQGMKQKVYVYKTGNGVIWGITGAIIFELAEIIRKSLDL